MGSSRWWGVEPLTVAFLVVAALAILLGLAVWGWIASVRRLRRRIKELDAAKRSQSTRYGQITEQFVPFAADWPWDPKRFRFLGDPIDGIQFTDDGVVFVEIKTNRSALNAVQRRIRDQVRAGRVAWHEVRLR
jgi:predicted Holliday junction resolvase-like endonuclease